MCILLVNLTLVQLVFAYFHIGFSRKKTNFLLKKFILGFYYNLSIINLNYTVFFLRSLFSIVFQIISKNGKILIFSEYTNLLTNMSKFLFQFLKIFFCFKFWNPGLLTYFQYFKKKINTKYVYLESIPDIILVLSYFYFYSVKNLANESAKLFIPISCLIDSSHNPLFLNYFILSNIKSNKSILFYLKLTEQFLIKFFFLKKRLFVNNLFLWINTIE